MARVNINLPNGHTIKIRNLPKIKMCAIEDWFGDIKIRNITPDELVDAFIYEATVSDQGLYEFNAEIGGE